MARRGWNKGALKQAPRPLWNGEPAPKRVSLKTGESNILTVPAGSEVEVNLPAGVRLMEVREPGKIPRFEFRADPDCPARKYRLLNPSPEAAR